ncbi:PAS domain-containing hybrid sensor histidine kinase/response regulator [Pleionea sediminis]|uniref:PAS domain-containing hybrid sensor histidine kinase/response regulator n=1 Tax=Pleionea sediminis TaxID=2569479 RepID=UPI001185D0A9|nr:PAS domain-containing protein [Pleionea sediminis]
MAERPSYQELEQKVRELENTVSSLYKEREQHADSYMRYKNVFMHMLYEVHIWQLVRDEQGVIKTWRLVDANPAALQAWNRNLSEVIDKTTDEIFPEANATTKFMPIVQKIFKEKKPHVWEEYFSGTDQTLFMISIPLDDQFISSGMDISDVKRTQNELYDTYLRLTESIKAANIGLWDWNLLTNTVWYSKEWKSQIGYDEEEVKNDFSEWKSRVHPDDLEKTMTAISESLENSSKDHESEFRFKHKDGTYRWILSHATVYRDESGKPSRMLGSHIDITQIKQMENALNQTQKMEALGTLASGIAHDFNNLLAPILGYSELIKLNLPVDSSESKNIEKIIESASRARKLAEKILVINRSSSLKKESVSLSKLIDEVLIVIQASSEKNIVIKKHIDKKIPPILADTSEIYQVVLNLCTNAFQAMENNGELTIRLKEVKEGTISLSSANQSCPYICLSVGDNGCGMNTDTLIHAYDPFFTTKQKGEQRGTGLGLAIVSNIVQKHRGLIEAESTLGNGSLFRVYLPAVPSEKLDVVENHETIFTHKNEKIMLIDDETALCELGNQLLEQLGYEVTSFTNPNYAIKEFEKNSSNFNLVITDYSMPNMMGPEVIKFIKEISHDTPVIMLTGYTNFTTQEYLKQWKCDAILPKPYQLYELGQAIRNILDK